MTEIANKTFDVPVLLVIFNRPEVSKRVFEAIRKAKPPKLFIAADGYRTDRSGEKELCELTKAAVSNVDWPCEVHHDYLDHNIGPCARVPLAIRWFFNNVERGIIFEDDCLPDPTFFSFCQELLEKYKDNKKIMHISGDNFQKGQKRGDKSYYFSHYPSAWGWATWRRAWDLYDEKMSHFPDFIKNRQINKIIPKTANGERRYWVNFFLKEYKGKFKFWDLKWVFTIWNFDALSITPNSNLITNIGFGDDASHTKGDLGMSFPTEPIYELIHPDKIIVNEDADRFLYKEFIKINRLKIIIAKFRTILKI